MEREKIAGMNMVYDIKRKGCRKNKGTGMPETTVTHQSAENNAILIKRLVKKTR